ncbi:MAG: DUF2189 domain-containing protein [Betaproteobacteria bacterium]|nr:DUF2189 domain-containing protein [Betaproteobacteria bacterium]
MSHIPPSSERRRLAPILPIEPDQPLAWLVLGFRDFSCNPWLSMAHGLLIALACAFVTWLSFDRFWLLAGLLSSGMVIAPILATSLYAMSRAIEQDEPVTLSLLLSTWTRWDLQLRAQPDNYWALIRFGLLLALAASGWVITSSAFVHLMAPVPIHTPMDFFRHVVASQEHRLFEWWLVLGGLLAAPMFASSVVAVPMLLDRRVTVLEAVLTSWKAVLTHPSTMALWGFLLIVFSVLGVFSLFLGLIVIVPLLGHASWHAYRALVDVNGLAPRLSQENGQA